MSVVTTRPPMYTLTTKVCYTIMCARTSFSTSNALYTACMDASIRNQQHKLHSCAKTDWIDHLNASECTGVSKTLALIHCAIDSPLGWLGSLSRSLSLLRRLRLCRGGLGRLLNLTEEQSIVLLDRLGVRVHGDGDSLVLQVDTLLDDVDCGFV